MKWKIKRILINGLFRLFAVYDIAGKSEWTWIVFDRGNGLGG